MMMMMMMSRKTAVHPSSNFRIVTVSVIVNLQAIMHQWIALFYSRVKESERPGPVVDHSSASRTRVKNKWIYTSAPHIRLRGMDKDNFTLPDYM